MYGSLQNIYVPQCCTTADYGLLAHNYRDYKYYTVSKLTIIPVKLVPTVFVEVQFDSSDNLKS
jgi:hypothetical protein